VLILTRKVGEKILIDGGFENGGVTLTLLGIQQGQARIGIEAPESMIVDREEIHLKRQSEKWADR